MPQLDLITFSLQVGLFFWLFWSIYILAINIILPHYLILNNTKAFLWNELLALLFKLFLYFIILIIIGFLLCPTFYGAGEELSFIEKTNNVSNIRMGLIENENIMPSSTEAEETIKESFKEKKSYFFSVKLKNFLSFFFNCFTTICNICLSLFEINFSKSSCQELSEKLLEESDDLVNIQRNLKIFRLELLNFSIENENFFEKNLLKKPEYSIVLGDFYFYVDMFYKKNIFYGLYNRNLKFGYKVIFDSNLEYLLENTLLEDKFLNYLINQFDFKEIKNINSIHLENELHILFPEKNEIIKKFFSKDSSYKRYKFFISKLVYINLNYSLKTDVEVGKLLFIKNKMDFPFYRNFFLGEILLMKNGVIFDQFNIFLDLLERIEKK